GRRRRDGRRRSAAAAVLQAAGAEVLVLDMEAFTGAPPPRVGLVVDALVGSGITGPLRGAALALLNAMRLRAVPIVSVDVPSGLDPGTGMIGDTVSADVTVAIGAVHPGLLLPGLAPFIGDLYLASLDGARAPLVRVVGAPDAPTWRE
ncbi:MAG: hypothetical protein GEU74_14750, partial [Nitriliruptorales bacterium]|nr:hypothetical protein [Nitriliruptorales bacterium]